jgi:asparagine synthase (glutamine-hydrolysing)
MLTAITVLWDGHERVEVRVPRDGAEAKQTSFFSLARDAKTQTTAVVIGDLFYRDEFCSRLSIRLAGRDRCSDAELVIEAYLRSGYDALEQLEGEFALILWDGTVRRLLALRDPTGSWPLYWSVRGAVVAVGTSAETLVDLLPGRSFDQDYLAEFLMWPNPHTELACERTAFADINRVRAGSVVEWAAGGSVCRRRYWDWQERIRSSPAITGEEAGQVVARLFAEAVRERLRGGPAAAHLSGGMDSSAVVCVARDLLADAGAAPLATLSLVYPCSGLAGEAPYIEMILKQRQGLVPRFVDGETVPDYEWFRLGLPRHDEPFAGLPGVGADRPLLEEARRSGATTVLTGFGSDELFASSPLTIADLLQQNRWLAAFREARRWARAENRGTWTFLRRYGLEQAWPWRWGDTGTWPRLGWYSVPPWVMPEFSRRYNMAERGRQHARRLSGAPLSDVVRRSALDASAGDWARWYLAEPLGLRLSHPFQDPRLKSFALGLPSQVTSVPGLRKPILQTATRGLLPEAIRNRRDKRGFDDVYGLGLVRNLGHLERMIQRSALRQLGLLDADKLIRVMRDAAMGVGDIRARERMDKTLALVAWFEAQVDNRPARGPWTIDYTDGGRGCGAASGQEDSSRSHVLDARPLSA